MYGIYYFRKSVRKNVCFIFILIIMLYNLMWYSPWGKIHKKLNWIEYIILGSFNTSEDVLLCRSGCDLRCCTPREVVIVKTCNCRSNFGLFQHPQLGKAIVTLIIKSPLPPFVRAIRVGSVLCLADDGDDLAGGGGLCVVRWRSASELGLGAHHRYQSWYHSYLESKQIYNI